MILDAYKCRIEVNAVTHAGTTPLMLAVKNNNEYTVEALLNSGANPLLTDQLGRDASAYNICLVHVDGVR